MTLEFLKKFNDLPLAVRQKISSPEAVEIIRSLEEKYGVDLAGFVMRVTVGDISFKELSAALNRDLGVEFENAASLESELKDQVFAPILDHLEPERLAAAKKEAAREIGEVVEEAIEDEKKGEGKILPAAKIDLSHLIPRRTERKPVIKNGSDKSVSLTGEEKEEEAEVEGFKKQAEAARPKQEDGPAAMLEAIIKEANISFSSENLLFRFKQIMTTYLRGVRTKIDIRETLVKGIINGGVNLDPREADRILSIAERRIQEEEKRLGLSGKKAEPAKFTLSGDEIKQALAEREAQKTQDGKIVSPAEEYDLAAELKKGTVAVPPKNETPAAVRIIPQTSNAASPSPSPASGEKEIRRTGVPVGGKKMIQDIKTPKVMGPIEELAYMDLVVFRRLDMDPKRRVEKIGEKIELLNNEGIDRKLAGIKAWRSSPVNKTYLSMGSESISEGKTVDAVILDRKAKGLNYLTKEEFESIMDLNNRLRF